MLFRRPGHLPRKRSRRERGLNSAGRWSSCEFIEISYFNHNGSSGRLHWRGIVAAEAHSGNEKHGVKPWRGGEPPSVDRSLSFFAALGGCSKATGGAVRSEPADGMIPSYSMPTRRLARICGPSAALASVPTMTNTMDDNDARDENNAIKTAQAPTMDGFHGVSIRTE